MHYHGKPSSEVSQIHMDMLCTFCGHATHYGLSQSSASSLANQSLQAMWKPSTNISTLAIVSMHDKSQHHFLVNVTYTSNVGNA